MIPGMDLHFLASYYSDTPQDFINNLFTTSLQPSPLTNVSKPSNSELPTPNYPFSPSSLSIQHTKSLTTSSTSCPSSCTICGDQAGQHLHYGAVSCFSCCQFFRRGKPKGEKCIISTKECIISRLNRTNCKPCR